MVTNPAPFSPPTFSRLTQLTPGDLNNEQRTAIATGFWDGGLLPRHGVAPENTAQLQTVIRHCQAHNWRILASGNGSKITWGPLAEPLSLGISSRKLNRIVDHAVADLTVTVEAGVKLTDLQAALRPHQQFLPLNPLYGDRATVGGIMASGCAGPWQQRYGGVRDLVLGFSFVRWDGEIAKAGGRVVKNVAGYDLMKLFIGSYGTLGFISHITFRLYPLPPHSQTLFLSGDRQNLADAVTILRRSGLAPTSALLISPQLSQAVARGEGIGLLIRFQNLAPVVAAQIGQVQQLATAKNLSSGTIDGAEELQLWQDLDTTLTNPTQERNLLCKFGLLPSQAVHFLEQIPGLAQIQMGSGIGYGRLPQMGWEELGKLRQFCQNHQGYLTVLEADVAYAQAGDRWGHSGQGLGMMAKIKQQFDPHHLFNGFQTQP